MSTKREAQRPQDDTEPARDPQRKTRRRRTMNPLAIPADAVPDGMSWEYKRVTVLGQEDKAYAMMVQENGWEAVSDEAAKAAGVMSEYGGLRLMQRPSYLTDEARQEDRDAARSAVRGKEMEARRNVTGTELGNERVANINKSYAPAGPRSIPD